MCQDDTPFDAVTTVDYSTSISSKMLRPPERKTSGRRGRPARGVHRRHGDRPRCRPTHRPRYCATRRQAPTRGRCSARPARTRTSTTPRSWWTWYPRLALPSYPRALAPTRVGDPHRAVPGRRGVRRQHSTGQFVMPASAVVRTARALTSRMGDCSSSGNRDGWRWKLGQQPYSQCARLA